MKIAVSSGKGGTGKTTVATNLAITASNAGKSVCYLDCDVEEPNGALFLKPDFRETQPVKVGLPQVDQEKCIHCGLCGEICQYSAIVPMEKKVLVFPELCHACAGCWFVCPENAITETFRQTGELNLGNAGNVQCVQGLLNIGEVMSPPVITEVKAAAPETELQIIDSPPGTSCPVIESVRDADLVLLVTEPTPFGLNDLRLAVEMVRAMKLPFAVIINRFDAGDTETRTYCEQQRIDVLAKIPDDRQVAEAYSRGEMACNAIPKYRELYSDLLQTILTQRSVDVVSQAARKDR